MCFMALSMLRKKPRNAGKDILHRQNLFVTSVVVLKVTVPQASHMTRAKATLSREGCDSN